MDGQRSTSKHRKKWDHENQDLEMPINAPAAKQVVLPQYRHYLNLLHKKNKLLTALKKKDKQEVDRERKEKGFSIYINGANQDLGVQDASHSHPRVRTASETRNPAMVKLEDLQRKLAEQNKRRVKTAPARERRRNWNLSSVDINTNEGSQRLKAPEILTGKYEDDFEETGPDDEGVSSDTESVGDSLSSSTSSLSTPRRQKVSYLKRKAAANREVQENTITLTLNELHKLRQSLQKNASIRQSMCMDVESVSYDGSEIFLDSGSDQSDDEEIEELDTLRAKQDESEDEREPNIEEEVEIEEDLVPAMDSISLGNSDTKMPPLFEPNDTIVLEFAPPADKKGKSLMLTRKKGAETDFPPKSSSSSKPPASVLPLQKSSSSGAVKSQHKSRPTLLASRRSTESKEDSKAEASAVVKAMQEENLQAARFTRASRHLPEPRRSQPSSVPSPTVSSQEPERKEDDEDPMSSIIQRVLTMAPRHQRDLMKTLTRIDDSVSEANSQRQAGSRVVTPSSPSKMAFSESDKAEVLLEIMSNWGNRSRVGLTEIQLLQASGSLVPVITSNVSVHGAHFQSGPVCVLFNGRTKTTKERNMWTCEWTGQPVEIRIQAPKSQLAAIRVWNWNKNIMELDVGMRHMRVFVDSKKVYDGEVEKGCGNHVFDYSKTIPLTDRKPAASPTKQLPPSLTRDRPKENGSPDKVSSHPPHSPLPANSLQRVLLSPLKGDSPSVPNDGHHHTFRSISRSSASSASSSGSHPSRPSSQNEERGTIRSKTRTLVRPTVLRQPSTGSDRSSPEDWTKEGMPEKKVSKTPRVSKRMAAKLDRRSSDTDTSRSNTDSIEQKPPLPPDKSVQRSADKMTSSKSQEKLALKTSPVPPLKSPHSSTALSPRPLNQKDMLNAGTDAHTSIVDKLKGMGTKENKRKKDFPQWLSPAETADLKDKSSNKDITTHLGGKIAFHQDDEDDIQSILDEELAIFSQSQAGCVPRTPKPSLSPEKNKAAASEAEDDLDEVSPMKQIQKKRAQWRTKQTEDKEDTWGSLSFFNKSHRGRLSLDMADDILDEYLAPPKKPEAVTHLPIPDEGFSFDDDYFVIPDLPAGRELVINIRSTWGDRHYVGLTSLQVFASTGEQVVVQKIRANPSDINILPEYDNDPRVVGNLLDGVSRTRDDTHMWLTPFSPGKNHFIYLTLARIYSIALIRIWNYNKSRIHSYRGAKDVVITLDNTVIFKGEIARACGGIEGGTEAFGDTILFTMDENILEAVSKNDDAFEVDMMSDEEEDVSFQRPSTADKEEDDKDRPFTRAAGVLKKGDENDMPRPTTDLVTFAGNCLVYKTHKLELNFTATWGDMHYLGLTALEVVGKDGEPLALNMSMLTAQPCDIRHLKGHEKDDRTLDKLIDGTTVTMLDEHMWLIPFTAGQSHKVTITFPRETLVSGLRIWNYNKSAEDTYRGARIMHVSVNDHSISPPEGFLVRKGPGNCYFDFAQEINFMPSGSDSTAQGCTHGANALPMPCGFIYQLQLFSTWGDPYYIGLNGIEFYDTQFNKITLTESNISAYPNSVNVLEQIQNDVRTPDKLIDGVNDTIDGRHMWLAPILPSILNRVYVIFDQPTAVSMIKIWNYSKTPLRGVKDFALLVDDLLVYNGTLPGEKTSARGILPTTVGSQRHHTIIFTDNKEIQRCEKNSIINSQTDDQTEDQDVQLMNNKKIVTKYADPHKANSGKLVNQALRPKTGVTAVMKRQR